ncbi:uncharacterized protein B0H18DRAFT_952131 [Fomitopsis serialis]|uniref:uncharacterized protein n=1 Tax=Fomitopsis serialis TaxID=139415 RepID=UPI00200769F8|nr:uncharacterized protein B0H18DRAFT_952131 [Neoantrodia serialis]KAH9932986.1 hypothetical protein B0H18DRAFT_952131 [Neoantrodia serialis]
MSTTASSSASSATQTGNIGGASQPPSGQLPFSFLMTFIAVFLFIVGCGFGTRRLSIELRRTIGHATGRCSALPPTPELWDIVPRTCHEAMGKFCEFLPLSVSYVREEKCDPSEPSTSPIPQIHFPEVPTGLRILEFVPFVSLFIAYRTLRRMREVQAAAAAGTFNHSSTVPEIPSPPVRAVKVAVLVAMPSPRRPNYRHSYNSSYSKDAADYAIPSLTYSSRPTGVGEERRKSSLSTGKERDSGYPESVSDEDAASRELVLGVVQVPWDTGEVELS